SRRYRSGGDRQESQSRHTDCGRREARSGEVKRRSRGNKAGTLREKFGGPTRLVGSSSSLERAVPAGAFLLRHRNQTATFDGRDRRGIRWASNSYIRRRTTSDVGRTTGPV